MNTSTPPPFQERERVPEKEFFLHGSIVPMITPFILEKDHTVVDETSVRQLVNYLIEGNSQAIFILGTRGEFREMNLEQKLRLITIVSRVGAGRIPILVGVSANNIDESIQLAQAAERAGASATVLTPMYGEGTPENKLATILKNTTIPVILYNNPDIQNGENLPIRFVESARENSRIIGVKDSSDNDKYFRALLNLQTYKFSVLQGRTGKIGDSLRQGARGIVNVLANLRPELFFNLCVSKSEEEFEGLLSQVQKLRSDLIEDGKVRTQRIKRHLQDFRNDPYSHGIITSAEMRVTSIDPK